MAPILGLGLAFIVFGLIGLLFLPWVGVPAAIIGAVLVIAFVAGFGRRAAAGPPGP